jgi:ribose transport system substrate-binding protein
MSGCAKLVPVGLAWLVLASGCDSGSFLPPPPPELSAQGEAAAPAVARNAVLILDGPENDDRRTWTQHALKEAGLEKLSLRVESPAAADTAARQAERIRDAAGRGASALIVEAVDAPEVVEALGQAREKGVKVVLLDRTVTSPEAGKGFPLVTYGSFAKASKVLVSEAVKAAEMAKRPPHGPALLLVNDRADYHARDRAGSIKDALKGAGIPLLETLTFHGDAASAEAVLKPKIEADPKVVYVFAEDDQGLSGAHAVFDALKKTGRTFLNAGYIAYDNRVNPRALQDCAAVVDRNVQGLARRATKTAASLIDGESVPDRIEVPLDVHGPTPRVEYPTDMMKKAAGVRPGPP